jgi:hypothetical protein
MDTAMLKVAARFCGPPDSANGGYFAGLVAAAIGEQVTVRLHRPPPLETDLLVSAAAPHESQSGWQPDWVVLDAAQSCASARRAKLELTAPEPPSYIEAFDACLHEPPAAQHPCPGCFVCGPARARGDGLRLFAQPLPGLPRVATPWLPDASLGRADGKVAPEFMAAALDCPGFHALRTGSRLWLLGEFTVHVDRLVHVDEPCVIVGWCIERRGRKAVVGTALYDEDGECCARAIGTWIEPRQPAMLASGEAAAGSAGQAL